LFVSGHEKSEVRSQIAEPFFAYFCNLTSYF
jgi:hypothetical protein